jgi:antitoxin (DNA-binding transcriptional repressor) of toxin-antitoxin stability system
MATVSIKKMPPEMAEIFDNLSKGESVTVLDEDGKPKVVLVTVAATPAEVQSRFQPIHDEWFEDWDKMAREIAKDWKSDKSALEVLSEMRR